MNQSWDEFIRGNWLQSYYDIDEENTIPEATRAWLYNNDTGLVAPYNYSYDAYQNWAGYDNSTGFTMKFCIAVENKTEDGMQEYYYGSWVKFYKLAEFGQTGTFTEPEL